MAEEIDTDIKSEVLRLKEQIGSISDQLCLAVKGDFGFTVEIRTVDESVQKLTMLLNFVIDTARRALTDVQEKNTKLIEMDKVKSDFMANVSHELRTPLTLILGPLQSILSDRSSQIPSQHLQNLQRMHRNTLRLYMLVNDLLDFSKVEAGKFDIHDELLDVNQLIYQLVDDAQGLAVERKLTLSFLSCDGLNHMLFDRKMLEKILMNLLSNALKFTPAGGNVKIQLKKQEETIILTVEDDGIGIPAAQISKLFERFHQVDSSSTRSHEGTGIGLALISQFAQLMQGNIMVESEEGKGSKFIVTLPIRLPSKEAKACDQSLPENIQSQKNKPTLSQLAIHGQSDGFPSGAEGLSEDRPLIVIADDNEDMRSYIISLLENDYKIIAVENGKLALEAIYEHRPEVILSDVMMPKMDGYELTRTIKGDPEIQNIPIILITAIAGKEAIVSGLEIGADDYLPKPFSPEELKARTASALRLHQNFTKIMELNHQTNALVKELSESQKILETSNQNLRKEIEERKKLEARNKALNAELITSARRAGMADIATSVLHNVGNVLNSVNTSITMIANKVSQSKVSYLPEIGILLSQNEKNIVTFLDKDPQGQRIPNYITKLANIWVEDKKYIMEEISSLGHNVQHISDIIVKQNAISGSLGVIEEVSITDVLEDALILNKTAYERAQISITRDFSPIKPVIVDRVKLLQIIVNLIKNSIESLLENDSQTKSLILRIQEKDDSYFVIQIIDNGVGILPENLNKMFSFGFTTKKNGHGFGLHVSALAIQEMGGSFFVESQGPGKGATFTLSLPYQPVKRRDGKDDEPKEKENFAR